MKLLLFAVFLVTLIASRRSDQELFRVLEEALAKVDRPRCEANEPAKERSCDCYTTYCQIDEVCSEGRYSSWQGYKGECNAATLGSQSQIDQHVHADLSSFKDGCSFNPATIPNDVLRAQQTPFYTNACKTTSSYACKRKSKCIWKDPIDQEELAVENMVAGNVEVNACHEPIFEYYKAKRAYDSAYQARLANLDLTSCKNYLSMKGDNCDTSFVKCVKHSRTNRLTGKKEYTGPSFCELSFQSCHDQENAIAKPEMKVEDQAWTKENGVKDASNGAGPFRMVVHEVVKIQGVGWVITGCIEQGTMLPDTKVEFLPRYQARGIAPTATGGTIRTIELNHHSVASAQSGDEVGVEVKKLNKHQMPRGGMVMYSGEKPDNMIEYVMGQTGHYSCPSGTEPIKSYDECWQAIDDHTGWKRAMGSTDWFDYGDRFCYLCVGCGNTVKFTPTPRKDASHGILLVCKKRSACWSEPVKAKPKERNEFRRFQHLETGLAGHSVTLIEHSSVDDDEHSSDDDEHSSDDEDEEKHVVVDLLQKLLHGFKDVEAKATSASNQKKK